MTLLELRLGIALKARKDSAGGDVLLDWYQTALKPTFAGRILGVDERIAERCALLHVPVTRPYRDSLFAATAAEHGLLVATRNVADFEAPRGRGRQSVGRDHLVTRLRIPEAGGNSAAPTRQTEMIIARRRARAAPLTARAPAL